MSKTTPTNEELDAAFARLVASPAYWNKSDPDHERVKGMVTKNFEILHEGESHGRRVSPIVIDTRTST